MWCPNKCTKRSSVVSASHQLSTLFCWSIPWNNLHFALSLISSLSSYGNYGFTIRDKLILLLLWFFYQFFSHKQSYAPIFLYRPATLKIYNGSKDTIYSYQQSILRIIWSFGLLIIIFGAKKASLVSGAA